MIGENTVNTLPDSTVEAFTHHGNLNTTILLDIDRAHEQWKKLATSGVNVSEVATKLESEGVSSFQKSFNELIGVLAQKAAEIK